MTEQTTRLVLPSHIEAVADAAAALTDFVKSCGLDEQAAFGVDMAVREAVTNAMVHGNEEDEANGIDEAEHAETGYDFSTVSSSSVLSRVTTEE